MACWGHQLKELVLPEGVKCLNRLSADGLLGAVAFLSIAPQGFAARFGRQSIFKPLDGGKGSGRGRGKKAKKRLQRVFCAVWRRRAVFGGFEVPPNRFPIADFRFSTSPVSRHASRLTSHISSFKFQVSGFTSHASRFKFHASRFTPHVSRLTFHRI